ncbi:hypothetical protein [Amycolatopsis orientalis]|uniref:hypothetical protein n=1 Tax=Amycolatopsis orientalis TaxID=31958 RepID=UPI0034DD17BD
MAPASSAADFLGLADVGRISPGACADLAVIDGDLPGAEEFQKNPRCVVKSGSVRARSRICGDTELRHQGPGAAPA